MPYAARTIVVTRATLALAALALAGCSEPRRPGDVTYRLQSPNGAEGAAVIELQGEVVSASSSDVGELVVHAVAVSPGVTRVVVVRREPGEIAFTAQVRDLDRPPVATVLEVSGADDAVRPSVAGYTVQH